MKNDCWKMNYLSTHGVGVLEYVGKNQVEARRQCKLSVGK